jgi:hypothetical protein
MLFGIFIGGAIGVLLFVFTQNALCFTVTGISLALGLIIGAGLDCKQETQQDK